MTNANTTPNQAAPAQKTPNVYHTPERFEQLTQFVESAFSAHKIRIESLPGDASFRRYHRVYLEALDGTSETQDLDPSYIVMDAPPQLESIESFVRIDTLMADKINVPTLLSKDLDNGFLVLQDFGSVEFAHLLADAKVKQDSGKIDALYRWAIDCLLALQHIEIDLAKQSFDVPDYDAPMLKREIGLFIDWFLPYIGVELDANAQAQWTSFTEQLIEKILAQPAVVVHRDYHSRNLMQDQYHSEDLGVIDFQDAVIGSYAYDLVSLVRDAYVDWSEEQIQSWVAYFWQQSKQLGLSHAKSIDAFVSDVNLMGLQRHLKVLGIFVRLSERDGKSRYLADIPKVWRDLMVEMQWLSENADANTKAFIQPIYEWLQQTVSPSFEQKFGGLGQ